MFYTSSLFSCNSTKQTITTNEIEKKDNMFQPIFAISTRTKMFLAELNTEISNTKNDIEKFNPSDKLIETYDIRKQDNNYIVSGFIKINDKFHRNNLEKIQVMLGVMAGNIATVQVPLQYLSQFLKTEGIEYFEISEKVTHH